MNGYRPEIKLGVSQARTPADPEPVVDTHWLNVTKPVTIRHSWATCQQTDQTTAFAADQSSGGAMGEMKILPRIQDVPPSSTFNLHEPERPQYTIRIIPSMCVPRAPAAPFTPTVKQESQEALMGGGGGSPSANSPIRISKLSLKIFNWGQVYEAPQRQKELS